MEPNDIAAILKAELALSEAFVKADGSHYEITVVGECFDGVSRVKQQQLVYGPLMDKIKDGTLHAISIKAYTPTEWERQRKLGMPL